MAETNDDLHTISDYSSFEQWRQTDVGSRRALAFQLTKSDIESYPKLDGTFIVDEAASMVKSSLHLNSVFKMPPLWGLTRDSWGPGERVLCDDSTLIELVLAGNLYDFIKKAFVPGK